MASSTKPLEPCKTQDGFMPSFGVPPTPRPTSHEGKGSSIMLGFSSLIPRWDIVTQPNPKLQYYIQKDSFPSGNDRYQTAASAFQEAVKEWNSLNLGLTFQSTPDPTAANFFVIYKPFDPEDPEKTRAESFFPINPKDVVVYELFFKQADRTRFKNTFIHELGHVLGLRHEFNNDTAVQFMQANDKSIMSYDFDRAFQQTDKEGTRAFYQLNNGEKVGGIPVRDYPLETRKAAGGNAA